jgi:cell division protein FtsB
VKQKEAALAELEATSTSLEKQIEQAKQGKEDTVLCAIGCV